MNQFVDSLLNRRKTFSATTQIGEPYNDAPGVRYTKAFKQLINDIDASGLVLPGFDWMTWVKDRDLPTEPMSSFEELRKWLTFYVRNERYVEGFWQTSTKDGFTNLLLESVYKHRHQARDMKTKAQQVNTEEKIFVDDNGEPLSWKAKLVTWLHIIYSVQGLVFASMLYGFLVKEENVRETVIFSIAQHYWIFILFLLFFYIMTAADLPKKVLPALFIVLAPYLYLLFGIDETIMRTLIDTAFIGQLTAFTAFAYLVLRVAFKGGVFEAGLQLLFLIPAFFGTLYYLQLQFEAQPNFLLYLLGVAAITIFNGVPIYRSLKDASILD